VRPDKNFVHGVDSGVPVLDHDLYAEYQRQWTQFNTAAQLGRLNKIKNILALNSVAQAQGIQVINTDSFAPVTDFAWPANIHWPVSVSFVDWAEQHRYPCAKWGHYFLPAHRSYADLVLAKLTMHTNTV
jgi:hypothetical protein